MLGLGFKNKFYVEKSFWYEKIIEPNRKKNKNFANYKKWNII